MPTVEALCGKVTLWLKIQETRFWLGILKSRKVSKRNLVHFPEFHFLFSSFFPLFLFHIFCCSWFLSPLPSPLTPALVPQPPSLPPIPPQPSLSPLTENPKVTSPPRALFTWTAPLLLTFTYLEMEGGENFAAFCFIMSGAFFFRFVFLQTQTCQTLVYVLHCIAFPSGKEPTENVWKWEAPDWSTLMPIIFKCTCQILELQPGFFLAKIWALVTHRKKTGLAS